MEGIIIAIVIALLGRIFAGGNKEEKELPSMPPFSNPKKPAQPPANEPKPARAETKTFTSLEDFTREIFGELAEKEKEVMQKLEPHTSKLERKEPEPAAIPSVFEPVTEPATELAVAPPVSSRMSTRPELGASRSIIQREKAKEYVKVPTSQQELVQAIIASEIIGQPKARQSRR